MAEPYTELILKNKRGSIEFAWSDEDLTIDAENSDERVWLCLNLSQSKELLDYLKKKLEPQ